LAGRDPCGVGRDICRQPQRRTTVCLWVLGLESGFLIGRSDALMVVNEPSQGRVARSSRGHGELCGARAMCRCKNEPTRGREPAMTEWGSHPVDPRAPLFGYARQCLPSTAGEQISNSLPSVHPPARRMWWVRSRRRGEADNGSLVQRLPRDHDPRHDGHACTVSARGAGLLS